MIYDSERKDVLNELTDTQGSIATDVEMLPTVHMRHHDHSWRR
jgi:hypothetical protein